MSIVEIARLFDFVREVGGPNRGKWVEMFQRMCGGQPGESWCAYFVCFVLAVYYGGYDKLPFKATGSCQDIFEAAKVKGWIVGTPRPNDLYLFRNAEGHAHHVGIVSKVWGEQDGAMVLTRCAGIAGNTSEDGKSDNGTGVFEHAIPEAVYVRLPGYAG